jgi:hypothetical protein
VLMIELSGKCKTGESIKVIMLSRHGHGKSPPSSILSDQRKLMIGEHNIIHEQYPTWEQVSQNPQSTTLTTHKKAKKVHTPHDASLAPSGIIEALQVASALQREVIKGMPTPEKYYVSSLKRTGETCGLEWGWLSALGLRAGEEIGKRGGWIEGEDRGCGIKATVIEVSLSNTKYRPLNT